jgi:phosphotransferase system HPr-like phosphotransfer protein
MADVPASIPPETVQSFMSRMTVQDARTVTADDWITLIALALIGGQRLIYEGGEGVLVPNDK